MTLPTNPTADQIAADVLERHAGRTMHEGQPLPHNVVLSIALTEARAEIDRLRAENEKAAIQVEEMRRYIEFAADAANAATHLRAAIAVILPPPGILEHIRSCVNAAISEFGDDAEDAPALEWLDAMIAALAEGEKAG